MDLRIFTEPQRGATYGTGSRTPCARPRTSLRRIYLQILDLHDLDHLELIVHQVAPELD